MFVRHSILAYNTLISIVANSLWMIQMTENKKEKQLTCVFWENVVCTFKQYRPNECLNERCPHYQRWERMMDEADELDDAEVEEALRSGVHPK